MRKIAFVVSLCLIMGCQQTLNLRVRASSSSVPRNHREQLIFDYFDALKDKRYADAYQLRAWYLTTSKLTLDEFAEIHLQEHTSLPTEILIREESKIGSSKDERCGYHYIVYAIYPDSRGFISGSISMQSKPHNSKNCLIDYNSAFGSTP